MSPKLIVSALASTLAMAVFALSTPAIRGAEHNNGASPLPAYAALPAPSIWAR